MSKEKLQFKNIQKYKHIYKNWKRADTLDIWCLVNSCFPPLLAISCETKSNHDMFPPTLRHFYVFTLSFHWLFVISIVILMAVWLPWIFILRHSSEMRSIQQPWVTTFKRSFWIPKCERRLPINISKRGFEEKWLDSVTGVSLLFQRFCEYTIGIQWLFSHNVVRVGCFLFQTWWWRRSFLVQSKWCYSEQG